MNENECFFEVSRLHHGVAMLDERIAAAPWREPQHIANDDKLGELDTVSGPLNLMKLTRILAEGQVSLASMKAYRESLVTRLDEAYQRFADHELGSLSNLREGSALGGQAEQCAFAIVAVLDSFTSQFEEHVDQKNSTVELLLEFSDEHGLPDQAKGDTEPLLGLGVVRLSEQVGAPCNGIRVGKDELRVVDEAHAVTEFINNITAAAGGLIREVASTERAHTVASETFSVSEDRDYAYGEAVFPSKVGGEMV